MAVNNTDNSHNFIYAFLARPLYSYDKAKANVLKSILPFIVIMGHMGQLVYTSLEMTIPWVAIAMYIFFAMSGYGLVISYLHRPAYINGFLRKSLSKLFIPYILTLLIFLVYRYLEGIDQLELLKSGGLYSFVPTSWFIWTLSYFYIFFFLVFRYVRTCNAIRVIIVCLFVVGYCWIAPLLGVPSWRYDKCPAFCVGMLFGLFDGIIRTRLFRWQAMICIVLLLLIAKFSHLQCFAPLCYPAATFFLMYAVGKIKESPIVKFVSSISLEMFIVQFIAIYIVMNDMKITSTAVAVPLVFTLDIIIAYIVHIINQRIVVILSQNRKN